MSQTNPPTPQEDYQIALEVFEKGDLKHACTHIAYALASNPSQSDWLDLLDRIIAASKDPLNNLVPAEQNMHYAVAAIRAYIYAKRKEYQDAFPIMLQIFRTLQVPVYLPWVSEWFNDIDALKACRVDSVAYILAAIISRIPGDTINDEKVKSALETMTPALDKLLQWYPQDSQLIATIAALIRKLGQHEKAIQLAERAYAHDANYYNSIMLALSYRAAGKIDIALEKYKIALSHDPENVSARLDMGDILIKAKRFKEALVRYEEALKREPQNGWAVPHRIYCKFMIEENIDYYNQLWDYVQAHPQSGHAVSLAETIGYQFYPYQHFLPRPSEAIINVVINLLQHGISPNTKGEFKMTSSALESPSARVVVERYLAELVGDKFKLAVSIEKVAQPDPRKTILPNLPYVLWDYDGIDPKPRYPKPDKQLAEAIVEIADSGFEIDEWARKAADLAEQIGTSNVEQLLSVMLYPAKPKQARAPWVVMHRVQVVAALVIAHLDSGWKDSVRQKVLMSLLFGPMDWTVEAAIVALSWIAKTNEDAAIDIGRAFAMLWENRPREGYVPYTYALIKCGLSLDNCPPQLVKALKAAEAYF